jgi:primase-polymerase (primpol)-like protein
MLITPALQLVIRTCAAFSIDESHGLKHSLQVMHYAETLWNLESSTFSSTFSSNNMKDVVLLSACLHDMCDKKYMNEADGLEYLDREMALFVPPETRKPVLDIVSTLSYSKVKKRGFPSLGDYQLAYHVVREADLLAAYDVDRCIIYSLIMEKSTYEQAVIRCINQFEQRMLRHMEDRLFVTSSGIEMAKQLHIEAEKRIQEFRNKYHV